MLHACACAGESWVPTICFRDAGSGGLTEASVIRHLPHPAKVGKVRFPHPLGLSVICWLKPATARQRGTFL
jgi:hypothetical protein